jgi:predicted unusual protein kinase regulating ubiquinone biosynthesis (AarF/ABC1/UbiB family)
MSTPDLSKLADNVASLNQDMTKVGTLVDRLDTTILKLADISANVSQLLAVHESKLSAQEIITKQTVDLVEKRRIEVEEKLQLIHARISSGEKELTAKIDDQYDDILKELKDMRKESTEQHNKLSNRITTMEKWMWTVMGAAGVFGALIGVLVNIYG